MTTHLWVLRCGHFRHDTVRADATEICLECKEYRVVIDDFYQQWHVTCSCGLNSQHGHVRKYAEMAMERHNKPMCNAKMQYYVRVPDKYKTAFRTRSDAPRKELPIEPPF